MCKEKPSYNEAASFEEVSENLPIAEMEKLLAEGVSLIDKTGKKVNSEEDLKELLNNKKK